ncbi:MAG: type II toxin-antitoxin system PemK/MazF family toxin [Bacteroidetes bacterium]|nr:MAG: type II toxin-antitoxin system PemK/MazF family toxin [Bacteroidota bacterium]
MNRGTIVLTPFPFTNLQGNKVRPALIVSSTKRKGNDVILAFISSVVEFPILETDYLLKISDPQFVSTGLKVDSIFKMDKLVTIDKSMIIGELGSVSDTLMKLLDKKLLLSFGL